MSNCNINISICNIELCGHEAGRKNPVFAGSRGVSSRAGPPNDAAGTRTRHSEGIGAGQVDQPVVSLANREWLAAPYDPVVPRTAGEVFQGTSRLSGR